MVTPLAPVKDREMLVRRRRDAPAAEEAVAVAVDEQRAHHPRRELFAAAPALIEAKLVQIDQVDRLQNEVGHIIFGHPFPQIHRQ